jgi:MOSC domain-containing protein YiiM
MACARQTHGMSALVTSVSSNGTYSFSKPPRDQIILIERFGVEGDVHAGVTVQHRSRMAADPTPPNLRQVHLIHAELHDELRDAGYEVKPGQLGENITTRGLDLLGLPRGTVLRFGSGGAAVQITGLRNPCNQINTFRPGLLKQVLRVDQQGRPVRKTGVMGVVLAGGPVRPGDPVTVELPETPHVPLDAV